MKKPLEERIKEYKLKHCYDKATAEQRDENAKKSIEELRNFRVNHPYDLDSQYDYVRKGAE